MNTEVTIIPDPKEQSGLIVGAVRWASVIYANISQLATITGKSRETVTRRLINLRYITTAGGKAAGKFYPTYRALALIHERKDPGDSPNDPYGEAWPEGDPLEPTTWRDLEADDE